MDYKQKYEEALERAKRYQGMIVLPAESMIETIFPELCESEDEKVRKHIIEVIKNHFSGEDADKCIAWLKKLKVFAEHGDGLYYFANSEFTYVGNPAWDNGSFLEKQGQKKYVEDLTQQEAMDIAVAKCFEQGKQKYALDIEIPFGAKDSELHEVAYIIPEGFHADIEDDKVIIKKGKRESDWSKEDENGLGDALWCCKQAASIAKDENDMGNVWYAEHWLKSIKNRIKGE